MPTLVQEELVKEHGPLKDCAAGVQHTCVLTGTACVCLAHGGRRRTCDACSVVMRPPFGVVRRAGKGQVFSWGSNSNGQCGTGTTDLCKSATAAMGLRGLKVVQIVSGPSHSIARTGGGPHLPT